MVAPSNREAHIVQEIQDRLSDQVREFYHQPRIAGLRPDLMAELPTGERLIFEIKFLTEERISDFERQARRAEEVLDQYIRATESDGGLVVYNQLPTATHWEYVTDLEGLLEDFGRVVEEIQERGEEEPTTGWGREEDRPEVETAEGRPVVFAAMPYDSKFDDTFFLGIRVAAARCGADAIRIDEEEFDDQIIARIHKEIQEAQAVVADLSESNPNVLYEVGYAEALNQNRIQISATPLSELPFNVQGWNTLEYHLGGVYHLQDDLEERLSQYLP